MSAPESFQTPETHRRSDPINDLREQARQRISQLTILLDEIEPARDASDLERIEAEIIAETDQVAGLIVAVHVQAAVDTAQGSGRTKELLESHPKNHKSDGSRTVRIHLSRGLPVELSVDYYRRKGTGPKRGKGLYPALILLGIHERRTPAASAEIALLATAMASMKEAAHMFEQLGRSLDVKTIRSICYLYAERARAAIKAESFALREGADGRRIGVSLDGGRIRIRTNKRGKRTAKGRKRYRGEWKEPKLLHVWSLDPQGHIDRSFLPIIDGTLRGPEEIYMLLCFYLRELDVQRADAVLFIADGAHWIWNRFERIITELALAPRKVFQFLDFYHAVEHLTALASLRKGWSSTYRKQWVSKQRRLLKQGHVERFIEAIEAACEGQKKKELHREKRYFIRNRKRLRFNNARRRRLPMGSGPMESAIRRVVNLRLKGAGIFWHEESADAMLLLRSYYKAGRWKMLVTLANSAPIEMFG